LKVRILPPDEWDKLAGLHLANGSKLPDPEMAQIAVAEEDDAIVGFVVIQFVPHVEPIWIAESHRGLQLWEPLIREAVSLLPSGTHFYGFHAHKGTEKVADVLGLTRHPWMVDEGVAP
jgi:hypothetical protein